MSQDANFNPSSSSEKNNDIYLCSSKRIKIGTNGLNYGAVAVLTIWSNDIAYRTIQVIEGGGNLVSANYDKFSVSGSRWKIDSNGKLRLKNPIKIYYYFDINNDKVYPSRSSFKLKDSNGNLLDSWCDEVNDDDNYYTTKVKYSSYPGYINYPDDSPYRLSSWKASGGGSYKIFNPGSFYNDELIEFLDDYNEVTLWSQWASANNDTDAEEVWSNIEYDVNYYNNHNTFKLYTKEQVKQVFSTTVTGSLPRERKTFEGKTIYLMNNINVGDIQTSSHPSLDGDGENYAMSFKGTLDGQNKTLTATIECHGGNAGLIPVLADGGMIKNLFLAGTLKYTGGGTSEIRIGGIVGTMDSGARIQRCDANQSSVTSNSSKDLMGGIVGAVYGGTISGCSVESKLFGHSYVGGIIGWLTGTPTVSINKFAGEARYLGSTGGKIGQIVGQGTVTQTTNYAEGTIDKGSATVNTSGYNP